MSDSLRRANFQVPEVAPCSSVSFFRVSWGPFPSRSCKPHAACELFCHVVTLSYLDLSAKRGVCSPLVSWFVRTFLPALCVFPLFEVVNGSYPRLFFSFCLISCTSPCGLDFFACEREFSFSPARAPKVLDSPIRFDRTSRAVISFRLLEGFSAPEKTGSFVPSWGLRPQSPFFSFFGSASVVLTPPFAVSPSSALFNCHRRRTNPPRDQFLRLPFSYRAKRHGADRTDFGVRRPRGVLWSGFFRSP